MAAIDIPRKKAGRPKTTGKTPLCCVRIPTSKLVQIDEWGRRNGLETRTAAFRALIEIGLAGGKQSSPT